MLLTASTGLARCTALWLGLLLAGQAMAEPSAPTSIYTCDVNGKRITSDRPIPECLTRDQRMLNGDGSSRGVRPPTLTEEERAAIDAARREEAAEEVRRKDAFRSDRNLLNRYPNEAAYGKAREIALDDLRNAVRKSESRVAALAEQRKPLLNEAEFYVGKPLPLNLRNQLDANDAAVEAQRSLIQNQQAELSRINQSKDIELARLRKLWGGAQPGSMGAMPSATAMAGSGASNNK